MAYSAPHLGELVYDWDIPGDEVALLQPDSETEYIPKGLAIDIAHAQGRHLVPEFQSDAEPVFCNIATLALPPRWERGPDRDPGAELDDELWFIGLCGKRDLLTGNPHTFGGRMSAWCPTERAGYNVSLDEGNEDPEDHNAWRTAVHRFRSTGNWLGRWRTCDVCGCGPANLGLGRCEPGFRGPGPQPLGGLPDPFRNRNLWPPLQRSPCDSDIRASPSRVIDG